LCIVLPATVVVNNYIVHPTTISPEVEYIQSITSKVTAYSSSNALLWSGSGVWVDKIHVLTARHVVMEADHWRVGRYLAKSAVMDIQHDVAMLTIEGSRSGPVARVDRSSLRIGDNVCLCGYMMALGSEVTWGKIANVVSDPNGIGEGDPVISITCAPGASGGPVLRDNKLVGIISRGTTGLVVSEPVVLFGMKVEE
jgi:S1-C subfamily serine protease